MANPNNRQRPESDVLASIVARLDGGEKVTSIAEEHGVTAASVYRWALFYRSEVIGPHGCRQAILERERAARERSNRQRQREREKIMSSLNRRERSMKEILSAPNVRKPRDYMENIAAYG